MTPTYRVLNKRMVICGCDRRFFLSGLFTGVSFLMALGAFLVGVIIFAVFLVMGFVYARDPVMLRLLLAPRRQARQYDPAKLKPFTVVIS